MKDIPNKDAAAIIFDENPFDMINDEDLLMSGDLHMLENDQGGHIEEEKKEEKEKEKDSERVGTPYYLAPELWKTNTCTKKSDIWAVGVILYELCCLQYPFPASELDELEKKVLNHKP